MNIQRSLLLAAVLVLGVGPVLAQGDAKVQERRQEIDSNAQATLDELMNAQAGVRDLFGRAAGYAVFTVTKGGFIVSGGGGNGVAVNKSTGAAHLHAHGDRRYRPRYRRAALQSRDACSKRRIGSTNSSPAGGILGRRPRPPRARKASPCSRVFSTASRSTRSLTKASWAGPTSPGRSSGSTTSCVSSQPVA